MKRIFTLLIILLFLAACAAPVVDEPTTEEVIATQPAYSIEPFVIAVEVDEDDPFSFVLRAYAEFALWSREDRGADLAERQAAFALWEEEHEELLLRFTAQPQWAFWGLSHFLYNNRRIVYALHDFNGDGVYELLLAYYLPGSDLRWPFDIYAMQNGMPVQQLQKFASDFGMEVFPSGAVTVVGRDSPSGGIWTRIYRFIGGQLSFSEELLAAYGRYYRVTGNERDGAWEDVEFTPISEHEFNRVMAHYGIDRENRLELDWRPLFVPE